MTSDRLSLARRERRALVETLRSVGPDAPTLCEGWTTRDLAAHLVVREGRPDAAIGAFVQALAPRLEVLRKRECERDWNELIERIRIGAPWYSPIRYADQLANAAEYLVHHEDVLRAQEGWEARQFDRSDLDRIWTLGTTVAKAFLRRVPARLELRTPQARVEDGPTPVSTGAALAPAVSVRAEPVEMLLWAFGRSAVQVDLSGAQEGIDAVLGVPRGI